MRTVKKWSLDAQSQIVQVTINRKPCLLRINAGTRDDVHVFKVGTGSDTVVLILNTNRGLGYAGLEAFTSGDKPDDSIFVGQVEELPWKEDFFDHAPINQARELERWLQW